jgi:hypothetical protein
MHLIMKQMPCLSNPHISKNKFQLKYGVISAQPLPTLVQQILIAYYFMLIRAIILILISKNRAEF